MEKIVAIAYTSHATAEFASREARHRLKFFAQAQNEKVGITGMLVYCEGMFVQVIEGPLWWWPRYTRASPKMPAIITLSCLRARRVTQECLGYGYLESEASPTATTPLSARFAAINCYVCSRNMHRSAPRNTFTRLLTPTPLANSSAGAVFSGILPWKRRQEGE